MTIAELAKVVDSLRDTVNKSLDKLIEKTEQNCITLVTYDGRLKRLEENDARRQKITDSLTISVIGVLLIEILRFIF